MSPIRTVKKRDGSVQDFDPRRIGEAIRKAAEAQGWLEFEGEARRLQEIVVRKLEEKGYGEERIPSVEEIQDEVEAVLREEGYGTLAERYHEYRRRHDELRKSRSTLFDVGKMVEEFIGERDWRVRENANLRPSISSMMFNSAGAINARYLLDKVYPPEVSDAHIDGDLHLHDLYQGVCGYCFSEDTRVLTREGFKYFWEVTPEDEIATLNLRTGELEYQKPLAKQEFYFDGYLYHWQNKAVDLLVTPEHRMLVRMALVKKRAKPDGERLRKYRRVFMLRDGGLSLRGVSGRVGIPLGTIQEWIYHGRKPVYRGHKLKVEPQVLINGWRILTAKQLSDHYSLYEFRKGGVRWRGKERDSFDFLSVRVWCGECGRRVPPDALNCPRCGSSSFTRKEEVKRVPAEVFVRFMGWYLAEGNVCISKKGYRIAISQLNGRKQKRIASIMREMGLNPCITRFHVSSHASWLYEYLKRLGGSKERFIPQEIKELPPNLLRLFLSELFAGDGVKRKGKLIRYYTASKKLAEDVVECLIKVGKCGTIREEKGRYEVTVIHRQLTPEFEGKPKLVRYRGKVYDLTVPNGTLLVERKGKVVWSGNCAGHSMEDILTKGLVSVGNNPHSHPPKHLDVALMQVVNYIGVMTQEWAGAQAFSWIDVYLAPFIREDGLSDRQLKQLLQMFVYNLNVTSRWGGQCVSEDTEVLTEEGWKRYDELSMEDRIATLNPEKRRIEFLKLEGIHVYDYEGELILLKNRVTEQLVTPNHRILRKKFNSETLEFTEAEKLLAFDSSPILPIAGENEGKKEVDENLLRLCAWVIAEGTFSDDRGRIAIYQSEKHVENCERIRECLRALGLEWNEQKRKTGWSKAPCIRFRLKDRSSRWLKRFLPRKEIPRWMFDLPAKQIRLFLEEYARADGHVDKNGRIRLYTNDEKLLDGLQALAVLAGFGCTAKRNTGGTAWNVNLVRNSFTRITKIEKVKYRGKVWCPTTKNGTFVARRNKKVFITGNSPFSNVTLACGVPEPLRGKPAVIGGRPLDKTYEEYEEEIERFDRAFLEVLLEGDAMGKPFTFPIPTFAITKDFPWEDGFSSLLFKVAAKYGLPYFQNFVRSDLSPWQVYSMCCRLSLDLRELQRNVTGGLFGSSPKTGSVGVVTINLSRAGYLAKGSEDELFRRLKYLCILAGRALEHKRKIVEKNIQTGLLPYTKEYFGDLKRHFSTIGVVGGHEMCLNMGIEGGIMSEEGRELCRRVLEFLREECRRLQEETGHLYNLEATPAEGVSYRLARLDRRKFGKAIATSGEREPFYTNSTQLPVDADFDLVEALEHQEPLQTLYTGGTVFHIYLGESLEDGSSSKNLMRKITSMTRLPYFTFTPTYSICGDHGYLRGEHPSCPICGRETDVYSRVVGYYRPVKNWNAGKQEEFRLRKKYDYGPPH
ncbi:MAG: ribonucleoside triphosphate reductase [Candidatus Hadarchaeales archaeon]